MPLVPPPLLALVAALGQRALPGGISRRGPARTAAAAAVWSMSVPLAGAASSRFRRSATTFDPLHPEQASHLVTTGANTITRNPMYVGMAGVLLGHAVWRGSWAALLPLGAFVVYLDRVQVAAEEAALLTNFGAEYDAYRATTPRWLDRRSLGLP